MTDARVVPNLLDITGLTKAFAGQVALSGVDLRVNAGEILALAGPNGSGKSTLIKVMAGYHHADQGRIVAFGKEVWPNEEDPGWRHRVRFIHQDLGLIPTLSAAENLALGSSYIRGGGFRIRWRQQRAHARELLGRYGVECDVEAPITALTPAERTVVAIARALDGWESPEGLLFVDEPTAALHEREAEQLFAAIRTIAAEGAGVVFVSHRSLEVLELAHRVAVLRDGVLVADRATEGLDEDGLMELIVGRRIEELYPEPPPPRSEVVLEVDELAGVKLAPVSFQLHRGEILGVAGLNGSGREEVPGLIFGTGPISGGEVRLAGERLTGRSVKATIRAGLAHVPADRAGQGAVMTQTARENVTLAALRPLWNGWRIDRTRERSDVREWMARLDVQPPTLDKPVDEFSGGNQQKLVMAKWLRTGPQVIVLDEPTQGVDVAAKATIYELLAQAAKDGASLIVCSSEAKPLASICDRVLVLRDGRLVSVLEGESLTSEAIVADSVSSGRERTTISRGSSAT